jgi:NTE family protein
VLDALTQFFRQAFANGRPATSPEQALVLSGGGARSAYQSGALQYIAQAFPETRFSIMQGVSAGAINIAQLASHTGSFRAAASDLVQHWRHLCDQDVFEPESSLSLVRRFIGQSWRDEDEVIAGARQALLDPAPLRDYLHRTFETRESELVGIRKNLEQGWLKACALLTTNYATGQTVTWVEGCDITGWERPNRRSVSTRLTVNHILASSALPLLFPAVNIGDGWYGDGGIRLTAPLSPSIHLGADRILAISTRYPRSRAEADAPATVGYPPAAQIMGILTNAIFLDVLDQDARTLEQINRLVRSLPRHKRNGFRPIQLLVLRPSEDLGRMAAHYPLRIDGALGLLTRGLGTDETESPDWLSMLLFNQDYITRLIELGWDDAHRRRDQIEAFLAGELDADEERALVEQ